MLELNKEKGYSVAKLCKLGGVSKSGYYKWLERKPSPKEIDDMSLSDEIRRIHLGSDKTFGVEWVQLALEVEAGAKVNIKRVRRLMRVLSLASVIRRKRKNYVPATPQQTSENVMGRNFAAAKPNQKWFTDVTYLKFGNGAKAYLSAVVDRCDMSVVAWKISAQNDNRLVLDTMRAAFASNPGAKPMVQVDRSSQYISGMFWDLKKEYGFEISMSRAGKLPGQPAHRVVLGNLQVRVLLPDEVSHLGIADQRNRGIHGFLYEQALRQKAGRAHAVPVQKLGIGRIKKAEAADASAKKQRNFFVF